MTPAWQRWLLILTSAFALAWSVFRACVQSITQDEGDTYFWFASQSIRYIWHPFPNNHVLNTLLIWISTRLFGLSPLTLRLPALLGAALFIAACYFLCRSITDRFSLQFPLLICLIYNPFIMDFMVAARGYSLANGFLMAAIAIPVWHQVNGRRSLRTSCALASLALGLSVAASFSFCFVDLAAFLALAIWALTRRTESILRIVSACVLPGLLVVMLLCEYPLAHWPKGEFFYTAHSLSEMTQSMMDASLDRIYPGFANFSIYQDVEDFKDLLLPFLGILCVFYLIATRRTTKFALALAGMVALCVFLHWIAYRMGKLPLPLTRTGLFFLPVCTLLAGVIAAAPARGEISRWLRNGLNAVFIGLACYFLLCLRSTYFREYQDGAETKAVYDVLTKINHSYGVTDTAMDGLYVAPLNFYRVLSKKETFPEFLYVSESALPPGKSIYVLHRDYYREFIKSQQLVVVYRGKLSQVVVAVPAGGPIPTTMIEP